MIDYQHMLQYVKDVLTCNGGEKSANPQQQFRSRSEHCRRTYEWCSRLLREEPISCLREDVLLTGAIFHDCGYNRQGIPHETMGAEIFRAYMNIHHPNQTELTETVCGMILLHSKKELLCTGYTAPELILLMEADLLDEEGAMGIMTDCFTIAHMERYDPDFIHNHLRNHAGSILNHTPMVTPYAKACWKEKQKVVSDFLAALEFDFFR